MRSWQHGSSPVVRLRPRGAGRFSRSGFLLLWLMGWIVGEVIVAAVLVVGAVRLVTGDLEPSLRVAAVAAFLLFWLTFWTIGGVAAIRELLQMVWASDEMEPRGGTLHVVKRLGPFSSVREYRRDELVRIAVRPGTLTLVAETRRGAVELSCLGTADERREAARRLSAELGLEASPAVEGPAVLPEGWAEAIDAEGHVVVVVDPRRHRELARAVSILAILAGAFALWLVLKTAENTNLLTAALVSLVVAASLAAAVVWLRRGRMEWRVGHGVLTLRRRFGANARTIFEGTRLELGVSADSDGDEWFQLDAIAAGRDASDTSRGSRRKITSSIHDPHPPRALGRWLSERAEVPLDDQTTNEARHAETSAWLAQLDDAGPVGRWLRRVFARSERS